ncbi:MAG TPA: ribbon-helix-helix domain-containing protein [Caulobacteraceae bacterium]|jgi:Arc/MetJ-type ribon-helix-helix transcriptional regulator|nr:ribbon-helix-helix domain-containing protein [Caulobacteraceae bacterium]
MSRSGKISVDLTPDQLSQVRRIVGAGEFASASAFLREAVRAFLHRRALHAGPHGATHFSRSLEARQDLAADPCERVELLFDAGDAKA